MVDVSLWRSCHSRAHEGTCKLVKSVCHTRGGQKLHGRLEWDTGRADPVSLKSEWRRMEPNTIVTLQVYVLP